MFAQPTGWGRFGSCWALAGLPASLAGLLLTGMLAVSSSAQVLPIPVPNQQQIPAPRAADAQNQAEEIFLAKFAEIQANWQAHLDAEAANRTIIEKLESKCRGEYLDNHARLLDEPDGVAHSPEFEELVRQQKILRMYLVELDARRQLQIPQQQSLQALLQQVHQLRRLPLANQPVMQQRIQDLEQRISSKYRSAQMSTSRNARKKTIRDIAKSLVEGPMDYDRDFHPYAHPTAQSGVLQDYRETMRQLVRIRWTGERLAIDRDHWDVPFAGKSEAAIADEVTTLLVSRGFKEPPNDPEQRMAYRGGGPQYRSNPQRLFQQFLGPNGGGGNYGVGRMRVELGVMTVMLDAGRPFCLEYSDNTGRRDLLKIRQAGDALSIQYLGEIVLDFQQTEKGNVRIRELNDDESFDLNAESFARLYQQHPEYCELRFFPLLDHLGIVPPLSRFDPAVIRFVARSAENLHRADGKSFQQLLMDLSDRDYVTREKAMDALQQDIDAYAGELMQALQDGGLTMEAKLRVRSLIHHAGREGRILESEAALVAQTHNLVNDLPYLEIAESRCVEPTRSLISARITQLEGPSADPVD